MRFLVHIICMVCLYFCRAMLCKPGLCRHAVSVCLSVRPSVRPSHQVFKEKVKEVDLYSAFIVVPHTQGAQVRMTQCYLQITPYLPLPRKHSPDGASPDWGCKHLIAAYYLFIYPERMTGWVSMDMGNWKYLSMAYTLGNKCAKKLFKRTVLLQLIIANVVTCFLEHSVYTRLKESKIMFCQAFQYYFDLRNLDLWPLTSWPPW